MRNKIKFMASVVGLFIVVLSGHSSAAEVENLVFNPEFEQNLQGWILEIHADFVQAVMEIDKEGVGDRRSAYINILNLEPGAETFRLQFKQSGIKVEQGKKYTWTFWAMSEEGVRPARLLVCMEVDPWGGLGGDKPIAINDEWQEFQLTFTALQDFDNTRLAIQLAGSEINLWVDHVKFYEGDYVPDDEIDIDPPDPDPEPGEAENAVSNPEFDMGTAFWLLEVHADFVDAIMLEDREMAIGDDHSARIDINNIEPGSETWRLQFKQPGHVVVGGETYTWSFWARTEPEGWREANVQICMETDPWTGLGVNEGIELEEEWQEYHFTFVAAQSFNNTRLAIQLGSSPESVWIDHVRLYEGEYDEEDFDEIMQWRPVTPAGKLRSTWGKVKSGI